MKRFHAFAMILLCLCQHVTAQTIDPGFEMPLALKSAEVFDILVLPDGKVLVSGNIRYVGTTQVGNIIRLNQDGTLDETFTFPIVDNLVNNYVYEILTQSDGDIVYRTPNKVGVITSSGVEKNSVSPTEEVWSFCIQPDDKILLSFWQGSNIFRYHDDLTPDNTFNSAVSVDGQIFDVKFSNNQILISGDFTTVNSITKNDVARLNIDGTLDVSFDTGVGTDDFVPGMTIQPDGKILLTEGYISSFNGILTNGLVRLNSNGSVDLGFTPPSFSGSVSEAAFQDGKILIGGYVSGGSLVRRLNMDGSLDISFSSIETTIPPDAIAITTDYSILCSNTSNLGDHYGLSNFSPSGVLESDFSPQVATLAAIRSGDFKNNKFIIGGDFIKVGDHTTYGLAKLNVDGSVDQSFQKNFWSSNEQFQVTIVNDQFFFASDGDLIKYDYSGNPLPDFDYNQFKDMYEVIKFIVLDNGKIIVGGANNMYRLNENGTEDTSFAVGTGSEGSNSTLFDISIVSENRVMYGSAFNGFNGTPVNRLVRINENGSLDATFNIGTGPNGTVGQVVPFGSDLLVRGSFTTFNGVSTSKKMIKLSENGSLDPTFHSNLSSMSGTILRINQPSSLDRIFLTLLKNFGRYALVPIKPDGTQDTDVILPSAITSADQINFVIPTENSLFVLGQFASDDMLEHKQILKIKLTNQKPLITATSVTTIEEDVNREFVPDDFIISDLDNAGPFTISLIDGDNYSIDGNLLIPAPNFVGPLMVMVKAHDGIEFGDPYEFQISVTNVNDPPQIIDVDSPSLSEDESITFSLSHFSIVDLDNSKNDFILELLPGANYSVVGTEIIPDLNFSGTLTVIAKVSDGSTDSEPYSFDMTVDTVNDAPIITEVDLLSTMEDIAISISLSHFEITDVDTDSNDLTLKLETGEHYTLEGTRLIPDLNFSGTLVVTAKVNDGSIDSSPFQFNLDVTAVNDAPVVKSSLVSSTEEDTLLPFFLTSFTVTDPDNVYPDDFSFTLIDGEHYSVSNNGVIPDLNYTGTLDVKVTVSDGSLVSGVFDFSVQVTAVNDKPVILGTTSDFKIDDTSKPLQISLENLNVSDVDNFDPQDFTLYVQNGDNYTVTNNSVLSDPEFIDGILDVKVIVNDGQEDSDPFIIPVQVSVVTGILENSFDSQVTIFPNPVLSELQVLYRGTDAIQSVSIMNATGLDVITLKQSARAQYYGDLSELNAGVFFVKIKTQSDTFVRKVVKR